ncbi:TolC family protein [Acidovorax sp. SUPP2522]|uniref:TolC family protein n=1 Tax=unclassified Acidovorax TaxID=2684926 RepID=UPI00234A03E4|nr:MULTISPECIES: TolC family protein [unclassified Acidovorax]WCM97830.1 TolC family protein [Acidovorax sp. GBBC 1281]GKT13499.1 TolC family protein [Acidovorax sp. SUPP2522]
MSIRHPCILLCALACALPGWSQTRASDSPAAPIATAPAAAPLAPQWTLAQALAAARDNSDVIQSRQALAAARADVLSADHAPLPVFSSKATSMDLQHGLGPGNVLTRKRIDKSVGIDWTWERGNKRELRTQAAQRAADAAQADVEDTQTQQLQAALAAYYDLLAAQERVRETAEIERSVAELARLADRRVKAGDLSAQDASRTRIEAERARADTQAATQLQEQAALALAQVTASSLAVQAGGTDWPALPAAAASGAAPGSGPLDGGGDLGAWAEARADVRAAIARVQSAQAALDNASALRKSDWTVGASVDHYPGTSNRLLEVRVQIPLQWGYQFQGEIGRAQAELTRAQDALDNTRRLALLDLQHLQQAALSAARRAASYDEGVLPRARQVAQSAELAYRKGAMPLTDLLDAQRTLRATALEALSARADYAKAQGAWLLRTQPQALLGSLP